MCIDLLVSKCIESALEHEKWAYEVVGNTKETYRKYGKTHKKEVSNEK